MSKLLDNKQMVHIATEIVVLLGMTFYFSSKTKKLMAHIENLSQRLEEQEELIHKHDEALGKIIALLKSQSPATARGTPPTTPRLQPSPSPSPSPLSHSHMNINKARQDDMNRKAAVIAAKQAQKEDEERKRRRRKPRMAAPPVRINNPTSSDDPDITDDDDLDAEIQAELNELEAKSPVRVHISPTPPGKAPTPPQSPVGKSPSGAKMPVIEEGSEEDLIEFDTSKAGLNNNMD